MADLTLTQSKSNPVQLPESLVASWLALGVPIEASLFVLRSWLDREVPT